MMKHKKLSIPHIFIILYGIILVVALLSYIIPAGQYDRIPDPVTGRAIIDSNSYHVVESKPTSLMELFEAFPNGFVDAGWVVVLTFCVCGGCSFSRKIQNFSAQITKINYFYKKTQMRKRIFERFSNTF